MSQATENSRKLGPRASPMALEIVFSPFLLAWLHPHCFWEIQNPSFSPQQPQWQLTSSSRTTWLQSQLLSSPGTTWPNLGSVPPMDLGICQGVLVNLNTCTGNWKTISKKKTKKKTLSLETVLQRR